MHFASASINKLRFVFTLVFIYIWQVVQLPSVSESESEFTLSFTSLIKADLVVCDDMDIATGGRHVKG